MAVYKRGGNWHMDVTIHGVRYREGLDTTDRREALGLEKKRVAEIQAGKAASKGGREFARKQFSEAADQFLEGRKPHVAARTYQLERNLLRPLRKFFGQVPLRRVRAEDVEAYQRVRRATGITGRTLNMEIGVLRQMMKKAKVWAIIAEDVKRDKENTTPIAKVLTADQKKLFFETASSNDGWMVAYCAAVLAVSTTCRGMELKHLRWRDVDLFERGMFIQRSKTQAGHRTIPLNADAMAALARLKERAEIVGSALPEHFVFPACERNKFDPNIPQKTWRTAWRSLVKEVAKRAGTSAASLAKQTGGDAEEARKRAAQPFLKFRFHDLRHQAITELAEAGAPDATMMALAGHVSREMLEHYSHVRMEAKRKAIDMLSSGLVKPVPAEEQKPASGAVN
jgi:integrase